MNEKVQKPPWKTTAAFRDLVLLSAFFILVSVLVYVFGAFETFQDWIRQQPQWEAWHIHDYLFVFVILAFALGLFSLRRWMELKREIAGRQRAEAALRESEERFRSVAQSATDAITVANSNGTIIAWNSAAQTTFGYGEAEVLGQPLTLLMPERFHDSHQRGLARFLSTGESHVIGKTVELAGRKKDGSEFPLELSLSTWRTAQGRFFAGILRDVTERQQAEAALRQSEEKYRALVETTATGFLIVDAQGRVLDANAEYVRLTGHATLAEIAGHSVVEWTAPHDLERNAAEVKQCAERGWTRNLEIDYVNRQGEITPIEVNATVIGSGEAVRILALCRDITERRRLQQERERLITELQQALAEVKELSGLLPICAGCKKIRDDRGYWNQIESYIVARSKAQFTHGLCPECVKTYFPDDDA
jgi:PAS domain S-box-containing protein